MDDIHPIVSAVLGTLIFVGLLVVLRKYLGVGWTVFIAVSVLVTWIYLVAPRTGPP